MNKKKIKKNTLEFIQKKVTKKKAKEGIVEEGTLGKLKFQIFKRGVIHIFNEKETLLFKKDCELFEDEIDKLKLNSLREDESTQIPGSGDNDTLTFTCNKGDIEITLEKPEYGLVKKLKKLLIKGKKKK